LCASNQSWGASTAATTDTPQNHKIRGLVRSHAPVGELLRANDRRASAQAPSEPHAVWHLDEVYLKIDGGTVRTWRAVDAEGEVLDVLVHSKRNRHAALKLMRKLLRSMPSPRSGW
jgi:transposase-like protein